MSNSIIHNYICFNFYTGWREIDQFYKNDLGNEISPQVTYILQLCDVKKEKTINEIASSMKLNMSATSNLIARMEKNRLVKRTHSEVDRRVVTVKLTQDGSELMGKLKSKIKQLEDKIANNISPEEKETLLNIVAKISKSREENTI